VRQEDRPFILTLLMEDASQGKFDQLREAHFPPERNYLRAHLTLFHKLPAEHEGEISADLKEACEDREPFSLNVTNIRFLGRGVAYELSSPELLSVRKELAALWGPWLGAQDRQGFKPHVTVQNKVSPDEARELHGSLQAAFSPFEVVGEGLSLWRYLDGPWERVGTYTFGSSMPADQPL